MNERFKPIERRLKTLDEHMRQGENFKNYRGHKTRYEKLYAEYESLKNTSGIGAGRKAQKALDTANEYYEAHRSELAMYENAERYLKGVLQARFDIKKLPPLTKWKAERERLTTEKGILRGEYSRLKDEIKEVEVIRKTAEQIARQIDPQSKERGKERTYEGR
jgi:RNA polymerase-interacting CarD/CdnL/TRCF family regulator